MTQWAADQVERKSVSALVPYARNARTHSDEQVAQIAGHGRVLAARKLGLAEIPVMVATGWSEAQKRAYVLADNKLALNAGWDADLLRVELADLQAFDFDLGLTGFSDEELAGLLAQSSEGLTDPDTVPDVPLVPVSASGDVWVMGGHRLCCGDSTVQTEVDKLMQGERGDLLFTDPPWNVKHGAVKAGNAQGYKSRKILNDHMDEADWAQFVAGFCASFYAVTKPGWSRVHSAG